MRKAVLLLLAMSAAAMSSCQEEKQAPEPKENIAALKEQFHGKYSLLSATSSVAVDLDEDGQASADLLQEVPDLANSNVEVRVGRSFLKESYVGFLAHFWQHQALMHVRNSTELIVIGFANQPTHHYFNFNKELTQLQVEQLPVSPTDNGQYPAPESITVTGTEQLLVITNRLVFVNKTWQSIRITAHYKRYTKTT